MKNDKLIMILPLIQRKLPGVGPGSAAAISGDSSLSSRGNVLQLNTDRLVQHKLVVCAVERHSHLNNLAPLQTDFTDTRTALRLFSLFQYFLVFSYLYFLPF